MDANTIKLIYFSPTGTTKKVLESIAQGTGVQTVEHVDVTQPEAETQAPLAIDGALPLFGAPVYGGRLPPDAAQRLRRIKGNDTPAIVVVLYGNREYEDALLELSDLVTEAGFVPVAGGAFIGEHSFDTEAFPIATGRPDGRDLAKAAEFGKAIGKKMQGVNGLDGMPPLQVPGDFPYKEWTKWPGVSPATQEDTCIRCEACIAACPTAAIALDGALITRAEACIQCCACVRACPTGARVMEHPRVREAQEWLSTHCRARKEPETFL
jgi:ferredoxin/flavodoxin